MKNNTGKRLYQIFAVITWSISAIADLLVFPYADDFVVKAVFSLSVKVAFLVILCIGKMNTGVFIIACANAVIPFLNLIEGGSLSAVLLLLAPVSLAVCTAYACLPLQGERRSAVKSICFLPVIFYFINTVLVQFQPGAAPWLIAVITFLVMYGLPYTFLGLWLGSGQTAKENTVQNTVHKKVDAEQLRQYKELLDSGVISQEEFDGKKKQLLDL